MKRIAIFLLLAALSGCTITVAPIPTKKKHGRQSRHYASSRTVKKKPSPPPAKNIKETWWIENYKKLEAAHGDYTIHDDAKIEPLPDGRFRVPDTVLAHYQDLLLTQPTPKETPP